MSITISLSPTLTSQLQTKATTFDISLNDLIEKLISQSVIRLGHSNQRWQETIQVETESIAASDTTASEITDDMGQLTMAEIVTRIKSRPRNRKSYHPATGTLDDVLAAFEADPPSAPPLTAEEWETHWWPIREEMRERDRIQ